MTDKLPQGLLALFAPRPALRYLPPTDHAPQDRRTARIDGIAQFLPELAAYKDQDDFTPTESWLERRDRLKEEKKAAVAKKLEDGLVAYKPKDDPNARDTDPYRTLFVGRLPFDVGENGLLREFDRYGAIDKVGNNLSSGLEI